MLYCMFTTPSQVSFHHHLSPLYPLLTSLIPFLSGHYDAVVCVYEGFFCFGGFFLKWYIYTMEYYSSIKKEVLLFATAWMDLQSIMLSEISQSETNSI